MAVTFAASLRCYTTIWRDYNWAATARSLPYEVLTAARGWIFDRWRLEWRTKFARRTKFGQDRNLGTKAAHGCR